VVLRDLPAELSRQDLLRMLERHGFGGCFDFVYLPRNFKKGRSFGYALVNMTSVQAAERLMQCFASRPDGIRSEWSIAMQGLEALVQRYRDSPVMHPAVPDELRPLLLSSGVVVKFPAPTKAVKLPENFH
jgi:hypothetical protein